MGVLRPGTPHPASTQHLSERSAGLDTTTVSHGHCAQERHAERLPRSPSSHRQSQELSIAPISTPWLLFRADISQEVLTLGRCASGAVWWWNAQTTLRQVEECVCVQFQFSTVVSPGSSPSWPWDWVCIVCSWQRHFHNRGWPPPVLFYEVHDWNPRSKRPHFRLT